MPLDRFDEMTEAALRAKLLERQMFIKDLHTSVQGVLGKKGFNAMNDVLEKLNKAME